MTLNDIRQEIKARTGDNQLSLTTIDRWVNLGIQQWASRGSWPSISETKTTDTTTASTREYALPTDFKRMLSVKLGSAATTTEPNATELGYVRYEDKDATGAAGYYINNADSVYGVLPTPTTTSLPIYLKYFKIPATLSGDTDVPPFPANYHELVIFFALKKYWELDDMNKSVYYDREFENMITQMKIDLSNQAVGSFGGRMMDTREFNRTSSNNLSW